MPSLTLPCISGNCEKWSIVHSSSCRGANTAVEGLFPLLWKTSQAVKLRSFKDRSPPTNPIENMKGEEVALSCMVVRVVMGGRKRFLTVLLESTVYFLKTWISLAMAIMAMMMTNKIVKKPPTLLLTYADLLNLHISFEGKMSNALKMPNPIASSIILANN